jgi:ASCH domain
MESTALSIKQPWAGLIMAGIKPVENRTWRTHYRGPLVVCASAKPDRDAYNDLAVRPGLTVTERVSVKLFEDHELLRPNGVALGTVDLLDVVEGYDSPWSSVGQLQWVLANPERFVVPFPVKGKLGLFTVIR